MGRVAMGSLVTIGGKYSQHSPYSLNSAHTDEDADALSLRGNYTSHQSNRKREDVDELEAMKRHNASVQAKHI